MFSVLIFGILAVILVVGGLVAAVRRRRTYEEHAVDADKIRRQRKAKRVQSRHDRRKRP